MAPKALSFTMAQAAAMKFWAHNPEATCGTMRVGFRVHDGRGGVDTILFARDVDDYVIESA